MKSIKYTLLSITIFGLLTFIGCGKKDPAPQIDPTQEIIDGLGKDWTITSVILDDADVSVDWTGFTLTFDSNKGYSATNLSVESVLVWPISGSYSFPNTNNANLILRDDGVQIIISNITETTATFTFSITSRNGRTDGLIGEWVFVMGS